MVKKLIILILLSSLVLVGCSKVQMSASYRQALEMSAINVAELNRRCQDGDPNACKLGLAEASETLDLLVDALHGRGE